MSRRSYYRKARSGFSLIEVMLVLVILVILMSLVGVYARGAQKRALMDSARTQIGGFRTAIESYQLDVRSYPSSNSGLESLFNAPSDLQNPDRWRGPYMDGKKVPDDPWDMPYQYKLNDADNYEIWSLGPDRAEGTEDDVRSTDA